eukprot:CAMPEP_0203765010 /NCGR_PEP_ID=MMETSP0098-20131031/18178_1 /ASSEMBLY_ACC=CAM_ASM_000208 /TAXON_ID=96639 /ORGANISM=" , Strain NY0313808BC1" /LENGTH=322 /DNA_ID=CAMNT_0050661225 /DNA_START=1492 /DNA_END=2457 /DNA_ORIENTATION=-
MDSGMQTTAVSVNDKDGFAHAAIERLGANLFRGAKEGLWKPWHQAGVFGGQVVGQCLSAAIQRTSREKRLHSMHAYFLKTIDQDVDVVYSVTVLRVGKSSTTQLVTAQQDGHPVCIVIASFTKLRVDESPCRERPMPHVPAPEGLMTDAEYYLTVKNDTRCPDSLGKLYEFNAWAAQNENPVEIRPVLVFDDLQAFGPAPKREVEYPKFTNEPKHMFWMKCKQDLPDDPSEHIKAMGVISDLGLLITAKGPNSTKKPPAMMASLDHTIWFHAEFRADDWLLFDLESPCAKNERGLAFGRVYNRNGELVVSLGQEGIIRQPAA